MVDAWADADDVETYTGIAAAGISNALLIRAQDIIELFAGTTFLATDNLSATNLRRLSRAVAYQAGWMTLHPDVYTNVDVDSVSQDGGSYTPSHANAALLAPLAKRHLDRLTWVQTPLRVRRRYNQYDYEGQGPRDSAVYDDNRVWIPMP